MSSFIDAYLPSAIPGYPCVSSPRTSTSIVANAGGAEQRNKNWSSPLRQFVLPEAIARAWPVIEALKRHWLIMDGPFSTFPWRDPLDFASIDLLVANEAETSVVARVSMLDQPLGTGDGFTRTFNLAKVYSLGGHNHVRPITLPVVDTLLVADAGALVSAADYDLSRPGGAVTFDVAPGLGHALTWGGLFDVEVRYEADDTFAGILRAYQAGGASDLNLFEVRPC
jgi:uncharacterized protein (TIGR02217 family)